ncbi:MAG: hypothetical protein MHM6MM_000409 [Cercozoa sp. M6MM]
MKLCFATLVATASVAATSTSGSPAYDPRYDRFQAQTQYKAPTPAPSSPYQSPSPSSNPNCLTLRWSFLNEHLNRLHDWLYFKDDDFAGAYGVDAYSDGYGTNGNIDAYQPTTVDALWQQLAIALKDIRQLRQIRAAPSSGDGCAASCQSAIRAGAPHLCPTVCVGIARAPAISLVVADATPNGKRLGGIDAKCSFSWSHLLEDSPAAQVEQNEAELLQSASSTMPPAAARSMLSRMRSKASKRTRPQQVAIVAGYRVPAVRDATHLRAAIRVGVDCEIWQGSGVKLWLGLVQEKETLRLFGDLQGGACGVVGIVGDLLANGKVMARQSTAHKVIHGGLIELDISEAVQKLVRRRDWRFNSMVVAMFEFLDQWGRPSSMRAQCRQAASHETLCLAGTFS